MFKKEIYVKRRSNLKLILGKGVVLIPGNDDSPTDSYKVSYPFRQNSIFSYYTGINKAPSVSLLIDIDNDQEMLFANEHSLEDQIWTGPLPPFNELAGQAGIKVVKKTSELKKEIDKIKTEKRFIHYPPTCRGETLIKLSTLLDKPIQNINNERSFELVKAIISQRECKSEEEISEIQEAIKVSRKIYLALLEKIQPGLKEKELLGIIENILSSHGLLSAFPNILTIHGEILHNFSNENVLHENDLLLIDTGVLSEEGYCSDITRTYPVSRKFTEKQKQIYDIVSKVQKSAIDFIKPNTLYRDVHLRACEVLTSCLMQLGLMKGNLQDAVNAGAHALFMPHGIGHLLGMDDHDMEILGEDNVGYDNEVRRSTQFGLSALRFARRLKVNHVMTVEPGIYFIPELIKTWKQENRLQEFINYNMLEKYLDFGGIRIEDDILVNEIGAKVLSSSIE